MTDGSHKSELDKFYDKVLPIIQQLFKAKTLLLVFNANTHCSDVNYKNEYGAGC